MILIKFYQKLGFFLFLFNGGRGKAELVDDAYRKDLADIIKVADKS